MSAMAFRVRKGRKQVTLSITPLIDVLFLLIIFFMLTGTFKRVGELELQLPRSSTSMPATEDEQVHQVELLVIEGGRLVLNGEDVEMARGPRTTTATISGLQVAVRNDRLRPRCGSERA